ncbi:MAG: hypothetical protein J6Q41_03120 [Firmicutes bacterium]|nr:hypothetical protein [Bacillota bacterium]
MGLFGNLLKKNENYVSPYAPSEKGEERELYFLSDLGTMKIGHQLEDRSRNVLYEAVVTKFSPIMAIDMDFIDHLNNKTTPHKVGHEINEEYSSILLDNRSGFKLDGEDIWKHLKLNGITVESSFMKGKVLWPQFRVFRNGEEIALVETSNQNVHEEDEEAAGAVGGVIPVRGFYRVFTREKNLDLLFVVIMAFARTEALDAAGGTFGLLFGKKK